MNSNATNKPHTGPKRVRTQEPDEEQETQKSPTRSTPSSPTKAAKNALELAVASLPTSLQPLILHFGHQIIAAHCKRYAKKSIMQRMEEDAKYIPRSAKATDFKITLSAGAKEDKERVSFLEQQIQQAKDSYESSLKSVIEECIALEIQAAKKEESQLIMDLFPAIGKAIQQLQGTDCDAHLQTVNALKMTPALLVYGPIEKHHQLPTLLPKPPYSGRGPKSNSKDDGIGICDSGRTNKSPPIPHRIIAATRELWHPTLHKMPRRHPRHPYSSIRQRSQQKPTST